MAEPASFFPPAAISPGTGAALRACDALPEHGGDAQCVQSRAQGLADGAIRFLDGAGKMIPSENARHGIGQFHVMKNGPAAGGTPHDVNIFRAAEIVIHHISCRLRTAEGEGGTGPEIEPQVRFAGDGSALEQPCVQRHIMGSGEHQKGQTVPPQCAGHAPGL